MPFFRISAVIGLFGVALGAFGAHALESRLEAAGRVDTWDTAVFYHLVHAVLLVAISFRRESESVPRAAWWCLAAGVVIFSGTLYALCLSGITMLGAITPLGGVALLVGWGLLAFKA